MDSIISSLHIVLIASGTILYTSVHVMVVWKISGYVGYPIGNWMVQKIHSCKMNRKKRKAVKPGD